MLLKNATSSCCQAVFPQFFHISSSFCAYINSKRERRNYQTAKGEKPMTKKMIVMALVGALSVAGVQCASAALPPAGVSSGEVAPAFGAANNGTHRFDKFAVKLGLTDVQQAQVKAVFAANRQVVAPLRKTLVDGRKQLRQLVQATPFDEAAVRALAASQEATRTELIVARARVQNQMQAILTPDQRALAQKLRQQRHHRKGNHDDSQF
jgi:protein CpxP